MSTDIPVTIWQPTNGNSEYSSTSVNHLVDTTGISVVDTTGISIVDSGVVVTRIPATIWSQDDSI